MGILSRPNLEEKHGPLDQNPTVRCRSITPPKIFMTFREFRSVRNNSEMTKMTPHMRKFECLCSFNHN